MPKEKVADKAEQYDVAVGWQRRGQSVQVGIETHDGRPIAATLGAGGGRSAAAELSSLWAELGRDGCNRLIRALRFARDQAFGRDE